MSVSLASGSGTQFNISSLGVMNSNVVNTNKNTFYTILIMGANSKYTSQLQSDEEFRDISEGLWRSRNIEKLDLQQRWVVRPSDIRNAILRIDPQIIHFSGYGKNDSGLVFEDENGESKSLSGLALSGLFELFADRIKCVVLNGCYSEIQAQAISQHIPYVIGTNQKVGDAAAREFAVGFYDALGAGRDIEFAYKMACISIRLAGISENLAPVLLKSSITDVVTPPETDQPYYNDRKTKPT